MTTRNYGAISTVEELAKFFGRLTPGDDPIGFDIETGYEGPDKEKYSIHPETAFVVGFSFTNSTDWARYVPLRHDTGENLDNREVARLLWPLAKTGRFVIHNAPFELRHLSKWFRQHLGGDANYGGTEGFDNGYFPFRSCTQVESYLAAEYQSFALKYLVKELFGHTMIELHELFPDLPKNKRKFLRFNILDPADPKVIEYACEDALWALALHRHYYDSVHDRLLYRVEKGVLDCVCDMEDFGVKYDWPLMRRTAEELHVFRDRYNAEIMAMLSEAVGAPVAINLASPKQVGEMLYGQLGLKTTVYTAASKDKPQSEKKMSTGAVALAGLAKKHPVVWRILRWKEMTRLLGTYLEKYEDAYGYAEDGHTHPNHMSAVVVTGRFAVSDPPYQQSPKKYHFDLVDAEQKHVDHAKVHGPKCTCDDERFRPEPGTCFTFNFRDAIIAPQDHYILGFDLSQAELRVIAGEAQETALLKAFESGQDVHTLTASLMLRVPVDQVTSDQRQVGKAQPVDELVLTPTGWRAIGELSVGDQVVARDGSAAGVTGVYAQGVRRVYRLSTSDGGSVRASDEHWWQVHPVGQNPRLMTTEELAKADLRSGRQWRYFLPQALPAQMNWADGPPSIHPYALGLLLGDGSFTTPTPLFYSTDDELVRSLAAMLPPQNILVKIDQPKGKCPGYRIVHAPGQDNRVATYLRKLGLAGKTAHGKFVPESYLCGDAPSRRLLLQGLLDTDGSPNGRRGFEFCSASRQLAEDVRALALSLGGRARIARTSGGTAWRVWGRLAGEMAPFRLSRKLAKLELAGEVKRAISAVEPDGFAECVCISIDHPDRLYVTRDYIVTHNTMNFALLYGMSPQGLGDRLGISLEEAEALYSKYFSAFSSIAVWGERQVARAKASGHVTSRFGRILPIWEYQSDKAWIRSKGDRAAVNYPVQGGATGDYMKLAMVRSRQRLQATGLSDRVHMVMNVHDALEYYVHRSVPPQDVIAVLQDAVIFDVPGWPPMAAEWHVAKKWGSPIEVELKPDGTFVMKGEQEIEVRPTVEIDDETGEEIEVLPDVDRDTILAAAHDTQPVTGVETPETPRPERVTYTEPTADGRQVIVTVVDMPDEESYRRFLSMLIAASGPNRITLRTPEGDLDLDIGTSISPADAATVALVLPGATVTYNATDIDPGEVIAGINF